jgi:hypothetical protein
MYKVGEKVRVRTDLVVGKRYGEISFFPTMAERMGQEATINRISGGNYTVNEFDYYWASEMLEPIFQVGDRVECINHFLIKNGMVGTVIDTTTATPGIGVEFDEYFAGNSCNGKGKNGYCYWIVKECLRKVESVMKLCDIRNGKHLCKATDGSWYIPMYDGGDVRFFDVKNGGWFSGVNDDLTNMYNKKYNIVEIKEIKTKSDLIMVLNGKQPIEALETVWKRHERTINITFGDESHRVTEETLRKIKEILT